MELFEVNKETCRRDGICADVCPRGIIDLPPDGFPRPAEGAEEMCIGCGHCVAVCPTASLTHRQVPVEQCPPMVAPGIQTRQYENLLRNRRSIRAYKDKPVSREDLARLVEIAHYSPTGRNGQTVSWLVFDGEREMQRLRDLGAGWMRWVRENQPENPLARDVTEMLEHYEAGNDKFLRGAPAFVLVHDGEENPMAAWNCAIALTNFEMAAVTMGLGCCCIGFALHAMADYPPFAEAMAIPEGNKAYGCMIVGYPKYKYQRVPVRRPAEIVWHP
jgi:nitroreductase/NAD-dependent dihydropyrimidine dehydrogenase PreA subunit